MAKEGGRLVLLKVDEDDNGSYTTVPGQVNTRFGGTGTVADTSDKDSLWNTALIVGLSGEITCQLVSIDNPQADYIRNAYVAGSTIKAQLIMNSDGDGYRGTFYVTQWDIGGDRNDARRVDITLQPNVGLTIVT